MLYEENTSLTTSITTVRPNLTIEYLSRMLIYGVMTSNLHPWTDMNTAMTPVTDTGDDTGLILI